MRVFIVEDETLAANKLGKMLLKLYPEMSIEGRADSISTAVKFLENNNNLDLIFLDIQLADGLSFEIFNQIQLQTPVIFTTAFDHYMLKAFKVNSIDYLLKPIEEDDLRQAIEKHKMLTSKMSQALPGQLLQMLQEFTQPKYRQRLLVKRGSQFIHIKTEALAYFYADGKLCFAVDNNNTKHIIDFTLSQLEEMLKPETFFRINRHMLVNIDGIKKVHTWMGGRLKLELSPDSSLDTTVSRERVIEFKEWFGGAI